MWCSNLAGGEKFFKKLFILFFFHSWKGRTNNTIKFWHVCCENMQMIQRKSNTTRIVCEEAKKKPLYTHHWKSLVSTLKNFFKPKHHLNPWHGNNLTIKKRKPKKLWYHFRRQKRPRRKKENENKYLQPWLKFKLSKLSLEVRFFFLPENIR